MKKNWILITCSSLMITLCATSVIARPSAPLPLLSRELSPAGAKLTQDLKDLRFDRLGHPAVRWDQIPPVLAPPERPHQLLVVLVRFPDLGFERFKGHSDEAGALTAFYQELLFDPQSARPNTLSHYFANQSAGKYHLQGRVLPPITLDHPRAHYGRPKRPEGGSWRNDSDVEGLVEEVLSKVGAAHPQLDWAQFDQWDPADVDQDGVRGEPDGYLDHLVMVYAGGGQSSCQGLYKLNRKLNPNVGPEVFATLSPAELECADRIWPHRFNVQRREGEGPRINGKLNARGGAPITETLWAKDYNMQSEYTEPSTFIHEFGHSIGLPDVYARQTNNSTGPWEVMSSTTSPIPQGLSAWSRIMLGWLKPQVILPPEAGGPAQREVELITLDTPDQNQETQNVQSSQRALLIALPPQKRKIELTELQAHQGEWALYSGQGNELNRDVTLDLDLRKLTQGRAKEPQVKLTFDAWWEIEAGWDFVYVEVRPHQKGARWERLVDAQQMTAKHGHDGPKSRPGFTGRSGDLDGDGKNESASGCDPRVKLKHGEDRVGVHPCETSTWSRATFDLSPWVGQHLAVRIRYFTDPAAVERGLLLDNLQVEITGDDQPLFRETFEGALSPLLKLNGFLKSRGRHEFEVPHFYIVEHRDPYAGSADLSSPQFRYDSALSRASLIFGYDPEREIMRALRLRARPGALIWYVNGQYAWSENEPTQNGSGRGFLLAVDAHPHEYKLPVFESNYRGERGLINTHYDLKAPKTQELLKRAALKTMCFVRDPWSYPRDLPQDLFYTCAGPQLGKMKVDGKTPRYVYEIINLLLPGAARHPYRRASELYDFRIRKDQITWSFRNRALRSLHLLDAPFASTPFEGGLEYLSVIDNVLQVDTRVSHLPVSRFSDTSRWQNPHLRFGGVQTPSYGLTLDFKDRSGGVSVKVNWSSTAQE